MGKAAEAKACVMMCWKERDRECLWLWVSPEILEYEYCWRVSCLCAFAACVLDARWGKHEMLTQKLAETRASEDRFHFIHACARIDPPTLGGLGAVVDDESSADAFMCPRNTCIGIFCFLKYLCLAKNAYAPTSPPLPSSFPSCLNVCVLYLTVGLIVGSCSKPSRGAFTLLLLRET